MDKSEDYLLKELKSAEIDNQKSLQKLESVKNIARNFFVLIMHRKS